MKYFLLLLALSFTTAFASERESSINPCDHAVARISAKYSELSEISTRMMVLSHDGPESYSVDFHESENCESVPSEYHSLQRRRERIEQELMDLRAERQRACPRVYPE